MTVVPTLHKPRLEALSDGVVAVVMTLLVLELKLEHLPQGATNAQMWEALRALRGPLFGYVLAFVFTGIFWVLHHALFALVQHINGKFVAVTLAFLLAVSLLPLSVSIYLRNTQAGPFGVVYFGSFAFVGLTLLAGIIYADRARLMTHAPRVAVQILYLRVITMTCAGLAAAVVAYFSAELASIPFIIALLIGRGLRRKLETKLSLTPS